MMMKGFMAGKGIHCNDVAFAGFVLCCESQKIPAINQKSKKVVKV